MHGKFVCLVAGLLSMCLTARAAEEPLPKVKLEPVFPRLKSENLVWMTPVPDGSGKVALVEQDGRIFTLKKGEDGSTPVEVLNLEPWEPHVSTEQGLFSVAFHPGFSSNGLIYTFCSRQKPLRTQVAEWKIPAGQDHVDTNSMRLLLEIPQPSDVHKSGLLLFGKDGYLYLSIGDGGGQNDQHGAAQNTSSIRGKILRIDVNSRTKIQVAGKTQELPYGIPADNPFVGEADFYENRIYKEIWAYGLRNPWRFSFDRETGEMWAGDVGQDNWEEIDLIVKGGNYGWGIREGAHHFKPGPDGAHYIDPVMEYPHKTNLLSQALFPKHSVGACVIGGYVYRGAKYPKLRGVYIYADYALGTIWGFRYEHGKVTASDTLLEQPKNITSFAEDLDGELYALSASGKVMSVTAP